MQRFVLPLCSQRYGTFKKDEKGRNRDHDEFPWFMLSLFMMILALYGLVVSGSWEVAGRLDTFAIRSKSFMDIMGKAARSVGTSVHVAMQEGTIALTDGLMLLQEDMLLAQQESSKLKEALGAIDKTPDGAAQYEEAQKVIFAQAARVKIIKSGLNAMEDPVPLKAFVGFLSNVLSVTTPLAELIPRHEVASKSLHASMQCISGIQQEVAKLESALTWSHNATAELGNHCNGFIDSASLLEHVSFVPSYEELVRKHVGNITEISISSLSNTTSFMKSAYMTKLLKLNLLKDVKAMTPEERTALVEQAEKTRQAALDLANVARTQATTSVNEVAVHLSAVAVDLDGLLTSLESYSLATGLLMHHLVRDVADFYKKFVMVCLGVACLMAFLAFFYACYLEYVYENEGVAHAFETDPKERQGCCWSCVRCIGYLFHFTGFYALMLLQDAVSLMLVFMTLLMGTMSLAQVGVATGCDNAAILSDDALCTKELQRLEGFVGGDLLQGRSCQQADVLMCQSMLGDVSVVYRTLFAAVLGTLVSCCIPRRLLVVWMSAQQNIYTAEVLADVDRGAKPSVGEYAAYSVP